MLSHKFTRNNYDWCLYHKLLKSEKVIHLWLYVDDMLIACQDMDDNLSLIAELRSEFEMKYLGNANKILGMEISRDRQRHELALLQQVYALKVLERFELSM